MTDLLTEGWGATRVINRSKYFSLDENWGDPARVSPWLVENLDAFRGLLGVPVHISPVKGAVLALGIGHSGASWHYPIKGRNTFAMAADIFPEGDLFRAWIIAMKLPFTGIGLYPYWTYSAKNLEGGLHLDVRYLEQAEERALWWCDRKWDSEKNKWVPFYRSMTRESDINAMVVALGVRK